MFTPRNRGASILAALVFVAILAVVVVVLENLSPASNPQSQGAQAAATTPQPQPCNLGEKSTSTGGSAAGLKATNAQCLPGCVYNVKPGTSAAPTPTVTTSGKSNPNQPAPQSCIEKYCANAQDKSPLCNPGKKVEIGLDGIKNASDSLNADLSTLQKQALAQTAVNNVLSASSGAGSSATDQIKTAIGNYYALGGDQSSLNQAFQSTKDNANANDMFCTDGGCTQLGTPSANDQIQKLTLAQQTSNACNDSSTCTDLPKTVALNPDINGNPAFQGPCVGGTMDPTTGACNGGYQGPCANGGKMDPATGACAAPTPACTGGNCPAGPAGQQQQPQTPNNTFGGGNSSALNSLLSGLAKGLATSLAAPTAPAAAAQACSTDPNTYAQQQAQYQQALQQYNYQLQQAQYQQQLNASYGNTSAIPPPLPAQPTACTPSTQTQCATQPQQPDPSTCTSGSWQPVYSGSCVVNWQCSNLGAQLSCQPQTADVGMSLAITYACAQGTATGSGFTASGQSGTSTAIVVAPPAGTNTATYGLTCTNGSVTSGAQCSVQVNNASIVLVANPRTVASGGTSQIGWVTAGMQSCTISSPDQPGFTTQNSSNTSVSGTATTLPITTYATFDLHCQTLSGGTKDATTVVSVAGAVVPTVTSSGTPSVTVSSTAGSTVNHGDTIGITWQSSNEPSTSAVSLWILDVTTNTPTALIAGAQALSGTYSWTVPAAGSACPTDGSFNICGADLVAGHQYEIEADVYSPANAYIGDGPPPASPVTPTYGDYFDGPAFTVGS